MGGVAGLLLFGSVLLHELGHSYAALRYRIPIGQITLFIFGGMAQMHRSPQARALDRGLTKPGARHTMRHRGSDPMWSGLFF